MKEILIQDNDAGQRLDKFILKFLPNMPKGLLYKLLRKKRIKCNGKRCEGSQQLCVGDVLTFYLADSFFSESKPTIRTSVPITKPITHSLSIVYEDSQIIIVEKPIGIDAHSGDDSQKKSLHAQVQAYLYQKGEYDPTREQSFAPSLCNRIDRNTSGLVIVAKTAAALREMNACIRTRDLHKKYLAVTCAPLPKRTDICDAWLLREKKKHCVTISNTQKSSAWQNICTEYHVLAEQGKKQLVLVTLHTGRTHQIRAHLAFLHAPLLGDRKYGGTANKDDYQALCAYALVFPDFAHDSPLVGLAGKMLHATMPEFVTTHFPHFPEKDILHSLEATTPTVPKALSQAP